MLAAKTYAGAFARRTHTHSAYTAIHAPRPTIIRLHVVNIHEVWERDDVIELVYPFSSYPSKYRPYSGGNTLAIAFSVCVPMCVYGVEADLAFRRH